MVKRYCLVGKLESRCNCDMKEHTLGAFVGLNEYYSLERERDGLMELLSQSSCATHGGGFSEYCIWCVERTKALAKGASQ